VTLLINLESFEIENIPFLRICPKPQVLPSLPTTVHLCFEKTDKNTQHFFCLKNLPEISLDRLMKERCAIDVL
jgi:hypothetical protein